MTAHRIQSLAFHLFIAACLTCALCSEAYAEDPWATIGTLQERIQTLDDEALASMRRLAEPDTMTQHQNWSYDQVSGLEWRLSGTQRDLIGLTISHNLALLVTDKQLIPHANGFIEIHRKHVAGGVQSGTQYTEKMLQRPADPETSRLLLAARDLFREIAERLEQLK